VVDLRGAFRYCAAGILVGGGVVIAVLGVMEPNPAVVALGIELGTTPFGFIFGERLVLSFKR
jgi:xanthosine utilization system XapX-like protein